MPLAHKPTILIILDGWGHSDNPYCNPIAHARKPTWDRLWNSYPHTLIDGSGLAVGLPPDQMGNSEVGHLNLGAGRVVYQEYTRISLAIEDGSFFTHPTLTGAVDHARQNGKAIHVMGLLSAGGVHSHELHIHAFLKLAAQRGAKKLYLHAFLDGRDTPPKSAEPSLVAVQRLTEELGHGQIATVIGRYYAMDRDHRWPRTQTAYDAIAAGNAPFTAPDALSALTNAYERGETDEFVQATTITPVGEKPVRIEDGDVVVFINYRADRARQLTRALIEKDFHGFARQYVPTLGAFVSLTEYHKDFNISVAYPPDQLRNVFGEYISTHGLRQLRIAETEKYAHVTFFFNGGREIPFPGEDRLLVPSPAVATYDLQPEMSAQVMTDRLVEAILDNKYDVIVCNFANADMVGHTGSFDATVKAIETLDACLGRVDAALQQVGGEMVVTADHGNAEQMCGEGTGQAHTAHTCNLVPFLYVGRPAEVAATGTLADVAPTLLRLMGLPQPTEMTGRPLVKLSN